MDIDGALRGIVIGHRRLLASTLLVVALTLFLFTASGPSSAAEAPFIAGPTASVPAAFVGSSVTISLSYRDDAPPGLVVMSLASGTGAFAHFTEVTFPANPDKQDIRLVAGNITIGEDGDDTPETTTMAAVLRCDASGIVHIYGRFYGFDGWGANAPLVVVACRTPAPGTPAPPPSGDRLPPPARSTFAPAFQFPTFTPHASRVELGQSATLTATYVDDAPSGQVMLVNRGDGRAQVTDAALTVNANSQKLTIWPGLLQLEDDADSIAETTVLVLQVRCIGKGLVILNLELRLDDGETIVPQALVGCGQDVPQPAVSGPACDPTPVPGAGSCPTQSPLSRPLSTSLPPQVIRPPTTGDVGLARR